MVKIVVNKGRKVWDRERHRDAREGEILDVKDVEAKILTFRGAASYAPAQAAAPKPAPPPPAPPPPAPPPPAPEPPPPATEWPAPAPHVPVAPPRQTALDDPPRRPYRRRDLAPEE